MSQLVLLATLAIAVIVPLWTARAVLGAILALLLKHRARSKPASSQAACRLQPEYRIMAMNPMSMWNC